MWKIKKMTELDATEFYQCLKLRIDTFVVEQKRIYHELDAFDPEAFHVFSKMINLVRLWRTLGSFLKRTM
ncbi:acetyltransferase [Fructobacillus ficulneus]|uniref:Acetyltransferase n=1 Tax=Fructobacillus ficulneus TaxID=157463 RepID=A0A0K8MGF4_9LACO|nr:acetyltransferase [Fructobacillus ficulneus]